MNLNYIVLTIVFGLNLLLGLTVFIQARAEKSSREFFAIFGGLLLWSGSLALFSKTSDYNTAILYVKIAYFSAMFTAISQINFALSFIEISQKRWTRAITGSLNLSVLLVTIIALFENLIVDGFVVFEPTQQIIRFGPGYPLYSVTIVAGFIAGTYLLFKQYRLETNPDKIQQLKYIIMGMTIPIVGGIVTNLILPAFSILSYYWVGPLFTLAMITLISVAILKHHLFNIKVIATELLIFSLWIFILARTVISENFQDIVANSTLLALTIIIGIFLIRSVLREVQTREKIEKLAGELELANEQLKQLDRQKSEFVSIASHQLRSPLTAIKGYSSLILEGSFGEVSDKVRGAVDTIFQSSQSLVVVIENFLNISRIEQGRMSYQFADLELVAFVKGIIDQLTPNAQKKGLAVSFEVKEGNHYTIKADAEKVRQVILNLFDNSIKYTPSGSIKLSLVRENNTSPIRLTIADTGIGMTHETQTRLFQKFSRADDAGKVNAGGAGLGLFLAAEIMKAHKGSVHAESDGPGKGSRFIVEFAD